MVINSLGQVGIGTTNPQTLLAVNGTITTKEVVVTNSGWSDFVFAPGYHLQPLEAVDAHIKKHGTLPGIPNAKQVSKDGVDLGQMQAKLLEKVEELTLYVIQLNKENQRLQEENSRYAREAGRFEERLARLEERAK